MDYEIVFCDIDGTLLNNEHRMLDSTIQAVKQLKAKDIPFAESDADRKTIVVAKELAEYTNIRQDFYFSQGSDSIFVHTSNGGALVNHIKRSARYMRFIPSEAFTNFFASFAHSLTHIEE